MYQHCLYSSWSCILPGLLAVKAIIISSQGGRQVVGSRVRQGNHLISQLKHLLDCLAEAMEVVVYQACKNKHNPNVKITFFGYPISLQLLSLETANQGKFASICSVYLCSEWPAMLTLAVIAVLPQYAHQGQVFVDLTQVQDGGIVELDDGGGLGVKRTRLCVLLITEIISHKFTLLLLQTTLILQCLIFAILQYYTIHARVIFAF